MTLDIFLSSFNTTIRFVLLLLFVFEFGFVFKLLVVTFDDGLVKDLNEVGLDKFDLINLFFTVMSLRFDDDGKRVFWCCILLSVTGVLVVVVVVGVINLKFGFSFARVTACIDVFMGLEVGEILRVLLELIAFLDVDVVVVVVVVVVNGVE